MNDFKVRVNRMAVILHPNDMGIEVNTVPMKNSTTKDLDKLIDLAMDENNEVAINLYNVLVDNHYLVPKTKENKDIPLPYQSV